MSAAERDAGEAILEAASDLFAERGYKATTTRAIAERAGVNEVTLFRRFGSKQGVLSALGASWTARMAGHAVEEMPDPADVAGTIRAIARLEVETAMRFGATAMRLVMDAPSCPEVADVMAGGPGANFAGLTEYLAARQVAGDLRDDVHPQAMAEALFALTSQLVMSRQVLGAAAASYDLDVEEASRQAIEIYLAGVMRTKR